ncbi:peptidase S33 [Knoellia sinensis KCTC 19936]|uniref:Peptidase S33 n=1 Tax=Knoellia sinensis KCTC 19936 TaxID=1385520 RepID=A0A0A0J6Y1_9MICO|nr:FtsQ-type POTRA domain-containing protein [Knoellia sinensis]KGN33120.1 peptidase S33 [Knoellia sinensis KCTC 19936]
MAVSTRGLASAEPRFRARALQRRRRPWLRILWTIVALAVVGALVWLVFWSPVLAARTVEVSGVTGADRTAVADLVDVDGTTPLARVDLEAVEQRVRTRRNIAEVSVERGWPSTLHVRAVPREPALVLKNPEGQLEVVDATGVAYGSVRTAPAGVPVVTADSTKGTTKPALEAALSVIHTLPSDLADQVSSIRVSTANLVSFTLGDVEVVWGGADEADRKLAILRALLATEPTSIDVSAPDTPVTRGGPSPSPSESESED